MDSLVELFHLDLRLLVAQIINFAIVVGVLYWFVFKPLLKTMGDRGSKIEQSLKEAKEIAERLDEAKAEQEKIILEAKKEAAALVAEARLAGEERKKELVDKAKQEIGQIISQEKDKLQADKAKTLAEIKAEAVDLVLAVATKFFQAKTDEKTDKDLITKLLKK